MSKAPQPHAHKWWELFQNPTKATRRVLVVIAAVVVILAIVVVVRPQVLDTISQIVKSRPGEQSQVSGQAIGPTVTGSKEGANVQESKHVNIQQTGDVQGNNEMNNNSKNK